MRVLPEPYDRLPEAELLTLRAQKQAEYEAIADCYHAAYADWALVMQALKRQAEKRRGAAV